MEQSRNYQIRKYNRVRLASIAASWQLQKTLLSMVEGCQNDKDIEHLKTLAWSKMINHMQRMIIFDALRKRAGVLYGGGYAAAAIEDVGLLAS